MLSLFLRLALAASLVASAHAYEPIPRRIPPAGKAIPAQKKADLAKGLEILRTEVAALKANPLLPDAEIYLKAVDLALEFEWGNGVREMGK